MPKLTISKILRPSTLILGTLLSSILACSDDKSDVKKAVSEVASLLSFTTDIPPFEKVRRASAVQKAFSNNVDLRGRGANETSAHRCGNNLVKDGLLALVTHFKTAEIDLGSMKIAVRRESAEVEVPVTVTARDRERGEMFRESNRLLIKLDKGQGVWKVNSVQNLDPASFEFSAESGSKESDKCPAT